MNSKGEHNYSANITWTGNSGEGTKDYKSYTRAHSIKIEGKPEILGSSDPSFRGDSSKYNPEDLLLVSLSTCHMLWYLNLCAVQGIIVHTYADNASGTMIENVDGSGCFTSVVLNPIITIQDISLKEEAEKLHEKANKMCFIANSVNFPIIHKPVILARE